MLSALTIRARVRSDLEGLRRPYLPALTGIQEERCKNYRFRTQIQRADLAKVMMSMIGGLHHKNFKDVVMKKQGLKRAHVYHDVWSYSYSLQEN